MDRRSHDGFSPKNAPDKNQIKSRANPHYGDYLCQPENQFMGGGDPRFYSGLVGNPYHLQGGGYGGMRTPSMLNHDILNQNMASQNYPTNYATSLANNQNFGRPPPDPNFDPSLMGKDATRGYYNANAKMSHANKNARNYAMNPELLCQGNAFPPMSAHLKEMYRNQELTYRNAVADMNKFQKSNPQLNLYHQNMTPKMGMYHHHQGTPTSENEGSSNAALYNNYNNMIEECTTFLNDIFDTHSIDLLVRSASSGAQNIGKSDPKMTAADPSSSPDDEPSLLMSDGDDSPIQTHHTNSSPMTSFDSSGLSKLEQDPFSPSTTTSIPSIPSITSIDSGIVVNFPISSPFSIPPYSNEGAAMSDSFISPQRPNDLISPAQLMFSPAQLTSSPAQPTTSPTQMMTSPAQMMTSPAQMMGSPAQIMASPAQPTPSPAQLVTSPEELNDSFSNPTMLDCLVSPAKRPTCVEASTSNCATQVVGSGDECFTTSEVPRMSTYNQEQSVGNSCVGDGNVACPEQLYFHPESAPSCESRFNPNNADLGPPMGSFMPHADPWAIEKSLNSRLDQQQPFVGHNYDCVPKKRGAPRKYPHPGRPPGSGNKTHSNLRAINQGEARCEVNPLTGEIRQKRKYVKTGKHSKKYKALMMMAASGGCGGPNPDFGPLTNRFPGPMDPFAPTFACPIGPTATNFADPQCSMGLQSPYFSEAAQRNAVSNVVQADVKPKLVHAEVKPMMGPAEVKPKVLPAEVKPKVGPAEVKPKMGPAEVKPKVGPAEVKSKVVHAEVRQKVAHAELKSKVVHAEVKPKVVHTQVKPKVVLEEFKSKVINAEVKPKVSLADAKPKVVNAEGKSKVVNAEGKPKVLNAEGKPKVVNAEGKPKVVNAEGKPKVVNAEGKPKVALAEAKPKVVNAEGKPKVALVENRPKGTHAEVKHQIRLPKPGIFEMSAPKNVKEIVKTGKGMEIIQRPSEKVGGARSEKKEAPPAVKVKVGPEVREPSPAVKIIGSEVMENEIPRQEDNSTKVGKVSGIPEEVEDMNESSDIEEVVEERGEKPRKRKYEKSGKHRKKKFCASVMYRTEISGGLKMKFSLAAAPPVYDAPKRRRRKRRKVVEEEGQEDEYDEDQGVWGKTLPEVVLKKIFKVVTDNEGCIPFLVRASQVCKLWRKVALEPCLWNNIDLSSAWVSKNPILNDHNFRWLCENRLARVKDLNLAGWTFSGIPGIFDKITKSCKDLRGIGLQGWEGLTHENITFLVSHYPNLERIDLSGINNNQKCSSKPGLSHNTLSFIAETINSHLEQLILSENKLGGIPVLIDSLAAHCPNLQLLDLSNIRTVGSVAYLNIEKLQAGCTKLRVLRFTNSELCLAPVSYKEQLSSPGFPLLEELSVACIANSLASTSTPFIDDNSIERLLRSSTKLTLLDVRGCLRITDSSLVRVPAWNLTHLYLSGSYVTRHDSGLDLIAQKWNHSLVDVDLAWTSVAKSLDAAVQVLAEPDTKSCLRVLDLSGSSVGYESIKCVLKKCHQLVSLNLCSCRGLPRGIKRHYQGHQIAELRSSTLLETKE